MTGIPICCNVQGDYGYKIIVAEEGDTISDVVQKAVDQVVGYLIPAFPDGTEFCARIHGSDDPLSHELTVKEANLVQMEAIDISVEA